MTDRTPTGLSDGAIALARLFVESDAAGVYQGRISAECWAHIPTEAADELYRFGVYVDDYGPDKFIECRGIDTAKTLVATLDAAAAAADDVLTEVRAQRNTLALAFDTFFYDLAYTAPEAIGDRLKQLANRINPVIPKFAEAPIVVGQLTFQEGEDVDL